LGLYLQMFSRFWQTLGDMWASDARRRKMTPEHAPSDEKSPRLNPASLSVEDAAKLLTKAGGVRISEAQIRKDIEANAPTNTDGTINLVHYAAWLVREMATGGATIDD
jgi:hypothetical protein